jgi:two-component system chemotaxis response regulator CheB
MHAASAVGTDRHTAVLVVEDSLSAREMLVGILESEPSLHVVGAVSSGKAAVAFLRAHTPDVILMAEGRDGLDGFDTTRQIMATQPVPIVLCGGSSGSVADRSSRAADAGAVAWVEKPDRAMQADFTRLAGQIRQTVKLMSEVRVVRRWSHARSSPSPTYSAPEGGAPLAVSVVGVGASTGGPQVLQRVLSRLPAAFPVPILVVQHIARGFLPGLVDWLNQTTPFTVKIGADCVMPQPGSVYLAPDDVNMGVVLGGRIRLHAGDPTSSLRPSVSHLFMSLANVCGPTAIGVLLTGMGKDGSAELKLMRDAGAITIAQDRESAVVNGMPGEAVRLGGATYIWPPDRIAAGLASMVATRNGGSAS